MLFFCRQTHHMLNCMILQHRVVERGDEALPEEPKLLITLTSGTKPLQRKTTPFKSFVLVCWFLVVVLGLFFSISGVNSVVLS